MNLSRQAEQRIRPARMHPKPLLFEAQRGGLRHTRAVNTGHYYAIRANVGCSLNICTAPPERAVAWSPLLSKSGRDNRWVSRAPLGQSRGTRPCRPPPAASGAPKFDTLRDQEACRGPALRREGSIGELRGDRDLDWRKDRC